MINFYKKVIPASIREKIYKILGGGIEIFYNKYRNIRWRQINSHNNIRVTGAFSLDQVIVGKYSYGPIKVFFYNKHDKLIIGNFVSIANGVQFLLGANHNTDLLMTFPIDTLITKTNIQNDTVSKGNIEIGDDVWIGTEALIMSGAKIGKGAVIGARTIINKEIPPYAIVIGNPAKILRFRYSKSIQDKLLQIDYSLLNEDFISENIEDFYTKVDEDAVETFLLKYQNRYCNNEY